MTPPTRPTVSVVICTHNRAGLLVDCLDAVMRQQLDDGSVQVVVVDDGSVDETPSVMSAVAPPDGVEVRYARQSHSGVNAARNRGVSESVADIVVFQDDDQVVPDGLLSALVGLFERHPDAAGVGGPVIDRGGSRTRLCNSCRWGTVSWGSVDLTDPSPQIVDSLPGGNMALRRSAVDKVGDFDESISGAGDESEWFVRAGGLTFLFDPSLWVWQRTDTFGLLESCRRAFRQGRSAPVATAVSGKQYEVRKLRMIRLLGHGLRHRCARGLTLFFVDLGGAYEHTRRTLRGRRSR